MSYARDPLILYIPSSFCVKCWYYFRGGKKENIPVYISISKTNGVWSCLGPESSISDRLI